MISWAGWRSWYLPDIQGTITHWYGRAVEPWVNTNSGTVPPETLSSGSDLNKPAEGPWSPLIDAGNIQYKGGAAWPANSFQTVQVQKEGANYGSVTSGANFGFRRWAFPAYGTRQAAVGKLPIVNDPWRPMWNNLPATLYHQMVVNPTQAKGQELVNRNANAYAMQGGTFGQPASLGNSFNQREVLL